MLVRVAQLGPEYPDVGGLRGPGVLADPGLPAVLPGVGLAVPLGDLRPVPAVLHELRRQPGLGRRALGGASVEDRGQVGVVPAQVAHGGVIEDRLVVVLPLGLWRSPVQAGPHREIAFRPAAAAADPRAPLAEPPGLEIPEAQGLATHGPLDSPPGYLGQAMLPRRLRGGHGTLDPCQERLPAGFRVRLPVVLGQALAREDCQGAQAGELGPRALAGGVLVRDDQDGYAREMRLESLPDQVQIRPGRDGHPGVAVGLPGLERVPGGGHDVPHALQDHDGHGLDAGIGDVDAVLAAHDASPFGDLADVPALHDACLEAHHPGPPIEGCHGQGAVLGLGPEPVPLGRECHPGPLEGLPGEHVDPAVLGQERRPEPPGPVRLGGSVQQLIGLQGDGSQQLTRLGEEMGRPTPLMAVEADCRELPIHVETGVLAAPDGVLLAAEGAGRNRGHPALLAARSRWMRSHCCSAQTAQYRRPSQAMRSPQQTQIPRDLQAGRLRAR